MTNGPQVPDRPRYISFSDGPHVDSLETRLLWLETKHEMIGTSLFTSLFGTLASVQDEGPQIVASRYGVDHGARDYVRAMQRRILWLETRLSMTPSDTSPKADDAVEEDPVAALIGLGIAGLLVGGMAAWEKAQDARSTRRAKKAGGVTPSKEEVDDTWGNGTTSRIEEPAAGE